MTNEYLGPVKVYRNTHKKCWSIKEKGKRVWHCQSAMMLSCLFKVSEAGRLRVMNTGRKNVHAYVVGNLIEIDNPPYLIEVNKAMTFNQVRYNPYICKDFYIGDSYALGYKISIGSSDIVVLTNKGEVYAKI